MNSQDRKIIETALSQCVAKIAVSPTFYPLHVIREELEYVLSVFDKKVFDTSKLASIDVGLYAAREFEDRDADFAERLYEVEDVVRKLREFHQPA